MISFITAMVGFWLLATTLFFDYHDNPLFYGDLAAACALIVLGLCFRSFRGVWKTWLLALIGVWLSFAPLLFWAPSAAIYLNGTLAGVAVLGIFLMMPIVPNMTPETGPSVPPGWSYNPSSYAQRIPVFFLAFCCWMISRYLTAYQLGYIDTVWDPFFDTKAVLTSDVSKAFPVADAGLGAFAYTMETLSSFGSERRWRTNPWLVLLFGLLTIPLSITSVVLIMLQPVVVGAWCTLCLINALLMLFPIAFAIDEVVATLQYLRYSKEKPLLKLVLEGGKCPESTPDNRSPHLDRSLWDLLKASAWGVTFTWNLTLSILFGVWLMIAPSQIAMTKLAADVDHIIGALVIVVSMTAYSEVVRNFRYVNCVLAALLIAIAPFTHPLSLVWHEIIVGILIGALAFRKGPIRERTEYRV